MGRQSRQGGAAAPTGRIGATAVRRWARTAGTGGAAALMALSGLTAAPASAAPALDILVSTDESAVRVAGPAVGAPVTVTVLRHLAPIATATAPATDLGGGVSGLELNTQVADPLLGSTTCWDAVTPEILPGDTVQVSSGGTTEAVLVSGVAITERPTRTDAATATIRGHVDPGTSLSSLGVVAKGDLVVAAPGRSAGVTGTLAWDTRPGAVPGDLVATFTGFQPGQVTAFLGSAVTLTDTAAVGASGAPSGTVATLDASPGPGDPDLCPPLRRRAVTTLDHGMVNLANRGSALTVSGDSVGASAVDVTVADSAGTTRHVAGRTAETPAGQKWTAVFPAGSLIDLLDGPLRIDATYAEGGVQQTGRGRTIWKDTVAPGAPSISPGGGTFTGTRAVDVTAPGADVFYTTDGTTPGLLNGVLVRGPVSVTESLTLRAVAIDPFGNAGPVARALFTRLDPPPAPPPAPTPPAPAATAPGAPTIGRAASGSPGGRATAIARWSAPARDGGTRISGYALTALRIVRGKVVATTTVTMPGSARSARIRLAKGTYRFQLRAVNAVGRSASSARSNAVRAR